MLHMESKNSGKKAAKPPSKFTRALKKLRDDLRRGRKSRQVCQHVTPQNKPCQQLGWPVVLTGARLQSLRQLGWACRVHRNEFKRAHGLEVYRRAAIPRLRAKRKMRTVDVWKGVDRLQWVEEQERRIKDQGGLRALLPHPGRFSVRKVDVWKGVNKERWLRVSNRRFERYQLRQKANDLRKRG